MIKELSELGKKLREEKSDDAWVHDALKEETISMVLTINQDGDFISLQSIENKKTMAEAVQRTSGKGARLLIDNCGYVLGTYNPNGNSFKKKVKDKGEQKAHEIFKKDVADKNILFVNRINELNKFPELEPVLKFYKSNRNLGIDILSQDVFLNTIPPKDREGNIAFLIFGNNKYVHEYDSVYSEIINRYETRQTGLVANQSKKCSVCSDDKFPIGDFPHYSIKGVPGDKEPAGGRKLITYNGDHNPFESYRMTGNENCMICTNCAKTYVEGLNWLLSAGNEVSVTDKKDKTKLVFRYSNRKNFGTDTTIIFWTRNNQTVSEIDLLEAPVADSVARMIESIHSGQAQNSNYLEIEHFYSCTLSGVAARIAIRDWVETSLDDIRKSIAIWFKDIAISGYDFELKKINTQYISLYDMARSCQRKNNDDSYDKLDTAISRVASSLWKTVLQATPIPLYILSKVLQRSRSDKNGINTERAALIKLILIRNFKGGNYMITEKGIEGELPIAYICGKIFAKFESIQFLALGDKNAGIREKYFTYAMTSPKAAFGRLFSLNSKHFTKLKSEKPGLAINLDKELQELCKQIDINKFPAIFLLEEQGQFAIGYYHQKQEQFSK